MIMAQTELFDSIAIAYHTGMVATVLVRFAICVCVAVFEDFILNQTDTAKRKTMANRLCFRDRLYLVLPEWVQFVRIFWPDCGTVVFRWTCTVRRKSFDKLALH